MRNQTSHVGQPSGENPFSKKFIISVDNFVENTVRSESRTRQYGLQVALRKM
jgi:hypothetical protein